MSAPRWCVPGLVLMALLAVAGPARAAADSVALAASSDTIYFGAAGDTTGSFFLSAAIGADTSATGFELQLTYNAAKLQFDTRAIQPGTFLTVNLGGADSGWLRVAVDNAGGTTIITGFRLVVDPANKGVNGSHTLVEGCRFLRPAGGDTPVSPADGIRVTSLGFRSPLDTPLTVRPDSFSIGLAAGDLTAPRIISAVINSDTAYTRTASVTVRVHATDNGRVVRTVLSGNATLDTGFPAGSDTAWCAVALTNAGTTAVIYVRVQDDSGNWSDLASDSIFFDTTGPRIAIARFNGLAAVPFNRGGTTTVGGVFADSFTAAETAALYVNDSPALLLNVVGGACTSPAQGLVRGLNRLVLRGWDAAGNEGADTYLLAWGDSYIVVADSPVTGALTDSWRVTAYAAGDTYWVVIRVLAPNDTPLPLTSKGGAGISGIDTGGSLTEFFALDAEGRDVGQDSASMPYITLSFAYGMNQYPHAVENLLEFWWLDPATLVWLPVDQQNFYRAGGLNADGDTLWVTVGHLSIYAIFGDTNAPAGTALQQNLDRVIIYPNPFRPYAGNNATGRPLTGGTGGVAAFDGRGIAIVNLPRNVDLWIYTLAGEEVTHSELRGLTSGVAVWDACTGRGRELASGIYLIVLKNPDTGQVRTFKQVIIR